MGRRRVHDNETREALLTAATTLFTESGPRAVTVRAVARLAGTTTRAVYSLFGSQPALLRVLRGRASDELVSFLMRVPMTDDPVDDLVRLGSAGFRDVVVERPVPYALVTRESGAAEAFGGFDPRILRLIGSRSHRVADTSGWAGADGETLAVQFLAAAVGLASVEASGLLPRGQEAATWQATLRGLVRGLGSPVVGPIGSLAPQHRAD
jgi:AcrR family transcriptional regulator